MVEKNQTESLILSDSNVTPISAASQLKVASDKGLPVSGLPAADELTETDYFPVVQQITSGEAETRRATMEQVKALIPTDIPIDPSKNNILVKNPKGLFVDKYDAGLAGYALGNINTSYGSDFSNDMAFSNGSGVWRYKTTIQLSRVPAGYSGYILTDVQLTNIPCDENGTPIVYTIHRTEINRQDGATYRKFLIVIFIISKTPTKQMDPDSGILTPVDDSNELEYTLRYVMAPTAPNVA